MPIAIETTTAMAPARVSLHGVALDRLTEEQTIGTVMENLDSRRGGWIVTANLDHLRRLVRNPEYRDLCAAADLVVADGMPLVWASRMQRTPLPERVAGSSLVWTLTEAAAKRGKSLFLLGGAPGTAARTGAAFMGRFPKLRLAGTCCPALGFEKHPPALSAVRQQIADARPDIVYVALGSPKQEKVIAAMRNALPGAWWIGVGISFSFVCGDVRRAPLWAQRCGLEWFHRLVQEPRRLARRYLIDDLPFAFEMFASALRNRPARSGTAGLALRDHW